MYHNGLRLLKTLWKLWITLCIAIVRKVELWYHKEDIGEYRGGDESMTDFFKNIRDVGPTVDHLIEGVEQKRIEFSSYKGLKDNAKVTEGIKRLKRCFDLADQLYDHTLVQREVFLDACERLKQWVEEVYKNTEMTDRCELNSYYQLARGNVRFRQALILNRWKPFPYSMCQEAQTCFEEAQKAEDSVCSWLAQHMAAKCEREMEKFRYHHSSSPSFQRGEGALKAFERIVKEIPSDNGELGRITLDAVINMGRCLRNQMKYDKAIPYFWEASCHLTAIYKNRMERKQDKNDVENRKCAIETLCAIEKLLESVDRKFEFIKAIKQKIKNASEQTDSLDSHYLQALVNLVSCLTDGPRAYAEAQKLALHVLKNIQKENTDMQNNLGRLYRKRGDYLKAKEAHGVVMDNQRRARKEGKSYFVDETASLNRYAELEQAKCSIKLKYFEQALEQLERLLGFYDKDPEVLLWKGLCYRNQGQVTQAVEVLKDLCEAEKVIRPGTVGLKARYAMGTCYLPGAPAQAKVWFNQIVQAEPSDVYARSDLGWCQQMLGEYQEAIKTYQKVNERLPYQRKDYVWISTNNNLGQCYLYPKVENEKADKSKNEALEKFCDVLKHESTNVRALCGAACCLRRLKKNAKNINVDVVKQLIGEEKIESEDFKSMAVALARKAREVAPGNPHVESEYVLCLLSDAEHCADELKKQVLNSKRVFTQELCVEALAKLAEHIEKHAEEGGLSYVSFCALRPMKWAAAEQVTALVDSPEFQTLGAEQQGKLLAYVYQLHHLMEQIKITLRLNRTQLRDHPCWHYTRMSTMQKLLLAQGEQQPKFRLSNVAYMNDSAEGESFGKLLEQYGSTRKTLQAYGLLPGSEGPGDSGLRNVYLTSLCTADDYIYMWAIYADKGTGCSLKFDENFFDVKDSYPQGYIPFHEEENSYPLYWIVYLTDEGKFKDSGRKLKQHLRRMSSLLKKIQRDMQGIPLSYITAMLDQVRYLFKYNEYASENEVRCLVVTRKCELAPGEGDTPYLYTEIDKEIRLDEVRFGPKVFKSPEKEAWMYATDRVKKVSYSNRHYR